MIVVHAIVNVKFVMKHILLATTLSLHQADQMQNSYVAPVVPAFLQMQKSPMKMGISKQWMNFKLATEYRQVSDSMTWNVS